jgi:hypothetical protein
LPAPSAAPKIAVIYYSRTGTVYELAKCVAEGAQRAGAEVRLLKVRELAPEEVITAKVGWVGRPGKAQDVPEATRDDVTWADGVIFGTHRPGSAMSRASSSSTSTHWVPCGSRVGSPTSLGSAYAGDLACGGIPAGQRGNIPPMYLRWE